MTATPRKLVHWALDVSMSDFGSPFSTASSVGSTSSLQYINSQLIAHGFVATPGLSLDGLASSDSEKVVKCLLGMLGQRVEDTGRTEDLTTKFRTLSYDHERLMSMHRSATDRAANAEREMNIYKSKLTTANRALQSSESAHKHTTTELQRTRTSLQGVRAAYTAEIKKKEKEVEKIVEKWSKLADAQAKLGTTAPSGIVRCANVGVVEGSEVVLGVGKGYLDAALDQAEDARKKLAEENLGLRRLIVNAVNEVQGMLHLARSTLSENDDEPTRQTVTTLFPLSPASTAHEKLTSLLSVLRDSVRTLNQSASISQSSNPSPALPVPATQPKYADGEIERLQAIVDKLRMELDQAHKVSAETAAQTQALFDRFADETVPESLRAATRTTGEVGEMSMDLMTAPAKDEERGRLEDMRHELDEERRKFTEAAVRLGREKAAIEAERIKFLDEKRSWQVEMMLADLPPTPAAAGSAPIPPISKNLIQQSGSRTVKSPRKSPRKSPVKNTVGKRRTTRVSRRSSSGLGLTSPAKATVEPPFETEVIPAPSFIAKSGTASSSLTTSFLPTSFVLPPPSPATSLPPHSAFPVVAPMPALPVDQISPPLGTQVHASSSSSHGGGAILDEPSTAPDPRTPPAPTPRRPFPMAKPFARGMMSHAYSPAKPSPLSRILSLADSPSSDTEPDSGPQLDVVVEEDGGVDEQPMFPVIPESKTLAAELGVNDADDGCSQNKRTDLPNVGPSKPKVFRAPEPKRFTAKEKGKGKIEQPPVVPTKRGATVNVEKENDTKRSRAATVPGAVSKQDGKRVENVKPAGKPAPTALGTTRPKPIAAKLPPGKGGARRVPIDSAEAAPVGRGWKA